MAEIIWNLIAMHQTTEGKYHTNAKTNSEYEFGVVYSLRPVHQDEDDG
jgi:hypothetical protein